VEVVMILCHLNLILYFHLHALVGVDLIWVIFLRCLLDLGELEEEVVAVLGVLVHFQLWIVLLQVRV
jgi:hypothetical protein